MWQKIIIGVLLAVSVFYLARRIFKTAVKGEDGGCADCPTSQSGKQPAK
jgi:hypothetical protein